MPLNQGGTRRGRRREVRACSGRRGEEYDDFGLYPWDSSSSFPDGNLILYYIIPLNIIFSIAMALVD